MLQSLFLLLKHNLGRPIELDDLDLTCWIADREQQIIDSNYQIKDDLHKKEDLIDTSVMSGNLSKQEAKETIEVLELRGGSRLSHLLGNAYLYRGAIASSPSHLGS